MANNTVPNRYNWRFSNYDKFMLKDKKTLIDYHIQDVLTKTLTMFKYENLPDTIPARELEKILQLCAFAYFLEKDGKYYVFYGGLGGQPNEYYQPTNFIVSNPYLKFFKVVDIPQNIIDNKEGEGVLIWCDYVHMGMYPRIRRYAEFMAECDITLRFGLINHRITSILEASDDTQKISVEEYLNDIEKGEKIGVIAGKSFFNEDGTLKVNNYRQATIQDIKDVIELQQYIKASFYNEIGLQANYNMKREAINGSEAGMNEEALKPLCDDMLECRKEALTRINKMYNLNITVKYNSSWEARTILGDETTKKETLTNINIDDDNKNKEVKENE